MRADKRRRFLYPILALLLTLAVWEGAARIADVRFFFPAFTDTEKALFSLVWTVGFCKTVAFSLLRVLFGWLIGVAVGAALVYPAKRFAFFGTFVRGLMAVLKSTPVASFILVLWFFIGSGAVPSFIAAVMSAPVVYQNLSDADAALDPNLAEVTKVFGFSPLAKLRYYYLPAAVGFLIPAAVTSSGLAWKAGIAAEVIAYTKDSIGREIYEAKNYFAGDAVFAWTLVVIFLSLILENGIKFFGRKAEARWHLH